MDNSENYMGFVFLPSMYEVIDNLPEEQAGKLALAIIKYGVTGICEKSNDILINSVMITLKPVIESGIQKYVRKVEDGNSGGATPKIDYDMALKLKNQGLTHDAIATKLCCSTSSINNFMRKKRQEDYQRTVNNGVNNTVTTASINKNQEKEYNIDSYNASDFDIDSASNFDFDIDSESKSESQPETENPIEESKNAIIDQNASSKNYNNSDIVGMFVSVTGVKDKNYISNVIDSVFYSNCITLQEIYDSFYSCMDEIQEAVKNKTEYDGKGNIHRGIVDIVAKIIEIECDRNKLPF